MFFTTIVISFHVNQLRIRRESTDVTVPNLAFLTLYYPWLLDRDSTSIHLIYVGKTLPTLLLLELVRLTFFYDRIVMPPTKMVLM